VARGINKVDLIGLPIISLVRESYGLSFNRYPSLSLKVELIEELRLHLTSLKRTGRLKNTIRQSRLTVVNVSDDAKISDLISCGHNFLLPMSHVIAALLHFEDALQS
jgi:hypothetical protein